jgi:hypothetical protein
VPSVRPAPDGGQSGGHHPTASSRSTRRLFLALALLRHAGKKHHETLKSRWPRLTAEVIATPGFSCCQGPKRSVGSWQSAANPCWARGSLSGRGRNCSPSIVFPRSSCAFPGRLRHCASCIFTQGPESTGCLCSAEDTSTVMQLVNRLGVIGNAFVAPKRLQCPLTPVGVHIGALPHHRGTTIGLGDCALS